MNSRFGVIPGLIIIPGILLFGLSGCMFPYRYTIQPTLTGSVTDIRSGKPVSDALVVSGMKPQAPTGKSWYSRTDETG